MINHWKEALYPNGIEYLTNTGKLKRTQKMLNMLKGIISLNEDSRVLEIGCNLARNLREVVKKYNCNVVGFDICDRLIKSDIEAFANNPKAEFYTKDLRGFGFEQYEDNYFDLGISVGVLMHIPKGDAKDKLVKNFLRVCKCVYLHEAFDKTKKNVNEENEYHIAFQDDYLKYSPKIYCVEESNHLMATYIYRDEGQCLVCFDSGMRIEYWGGVSKKHYCRCKKGLNLLQNDEKRNKKFCKCEECLLKNFF